LLPEAEGAVREQPESCVRERAERTPGSKARSLLPDWSRAGLPEAIWASMHRYKAFQEFGPLFFSCPQARGP
jgi:hypothetical protein